MRGRIQQNNLACNQWAETAPGMRSVENEENLANYMYKALTTHGILNFTLSTSYMADTVYMTNQLISRLQLDAHLSPSIRRVLHSILPPSGLQAQPRLTSHAGTITENKPLLCSCLANPVRSIPYTSSAPCWQQISVRQELAGT